MLVSTNDFKLSGDRFTVVYKLTGNHMEARAKAEDICLEQTVEFPAELVPQGLIQDHIVGRIESFSAYDEATYQAVISYAVETTSFELTQLMNVMFGNISMKPGIIVESFSLPNSLLKHFHGPRWGIQGIRDKLGIPSRPLLFTALKPMGLSSQELSHLSAQFAFGGIDIIKDDHGLSNQGFATFLDRVKCCADAVNEANMKTGRKSIYVPNITAPFGEIVARARKAKELGAGGLLISPGLTGMDAMKTIAEDDSIGLPIFSHPALLGSYVLGTSGFSHGALFGQMARLSGADATIYPNFGGRFSFSLDECKAIAHACTDNMGGLKEIFPCPAGGMSLTSIPESLKIYGNDVIFLVGGGLFKHGPDLEANCRYFMSMIERFGQ